MLWKNNIEDFNKKSGEFLLKLEIICIQYWGGFFATEL
jgi:hypothetical protein